MGACLEMPGPFWSKKVFNKAKTIFDLALLVN